MLLEQRAAKIRLLVLDVDGVLTDGGLYYDHEGRITKRFNVQDGLGIKLGQAGGLEIAVISGLAHKGVEKRVRELGIEHYVGGHRHKVPFLDSIRSKLGIGWDEIAFLGDDWVDMDCLRKVGLPMAVPNAQPEVKEIALWQSGHPGGHGAVREAVMFLLRARGSLDAVWRSWSGENED